MSNDPAHVAWFEPAPGGAPRPDDIALNPAKWMYERLVRSVIAFEKKLDATREIGARLIQFAPGETIAIDDIGFWGPDLITFFGRNADGNPVELMQHISQVNLLLVAVPVSGKPKRIGFLLERHLSESGETV
jgi:hypothetical protein